MEPKSLKPLTISDFEEAINIIANSEGPLPSAFNMEILMDKINELIDEINKLKNKPETIL